MYNLCGHCNKTYIEEEEEICVECAVFFSDENESIGKYFEERNLDEVNGDMLNDFGASLSEKEY